MSHAASPLVLSATREGVTTLTMNMPRRLNGWTRPMLDALRDGLRQAADDPNTQVLILTGAETYYSAGVNLGGTLELGHPKALHAAIIEYNQTLFDTFLDFPKPILVAANGPAIGASVTSATLCDAIIASDRATFSTPFAKLGVPPEGCSSVMFPRALGPDVAQRILGAEGWKPDAAQALEVGLVQWVVPHEELLERAHEVARGWIDQGRTRSFRGGFSRQELKRVNAAESVAVATAFLAAPFLKGQFDFMWGKKKRGPALIFLGLWLTRPAWGLLM